jgi:uncharacterized protein YndB with AHSA1/START domain
MNTVAFSIRIDAPKEKVWDSLWSDAGYRKWTAPFAEGSYAETDWQEGSKIKFLSPDGGGMYGIIQSKIPFVQMSFQHHGEIKRGVEESQEWAGAMEQYYLTEINGTTELRVTMDITEDFQSYFNETFPKALAIVKQMAEQ